MPSFGSSFGGSFGSGGSSSSSSSGGGGHAFGSGAFGSSSSGSSSPASPGVAPQGQPFGFGAFGGSAFGMGAPLSTDPVPSAFGNTSFGSGAFGSGFPAFTSLGSGSGSGGGGGCSGGSFGSGPFGSGSFGCIPDTTEECVSGVFGVGAFGSGAFGCSGGSSPASPPPVQAPVLNCTETHNDLSRPAALQCISTHMSPRTLACTEVRNSLYSPLNCVDVHNALKEGVLQCVDSRNVIRTTNPVLGCMTTSADLVLNRRVIRAPLALVWENSTTSSWVAPPVGSVWQNGAAQAVQLQATEPWVDNAGVTHPETFYWADASGQVQTDFTGWVDDFGNPMITGMGFGYFDEDGLPINPQPPSPSADEQVAGDLAAGAAGALCIEEMFEVTDTSPGRNMPMDYETVAITSDKNSYAHELTLTFVEEADWVLIVPLKSTIEVTLGSFKWIFIAENRSRTSSRDGYTYSISARSQTIKLGDRLAPRITADFKDSQLRTVLRKMASFGGIDLEYRVADVLIEPDAFSANDQTPIDVISSAAKALGAILRSHPYLPTLYIEYPSQFSAEPQQSLTFLSSIDRLDETWDWKPSWTSVIVSPKSDTQDADSPKPKCSLSQVKDKIRVTAVPFLDYKVHHASLAGMELFYEGVHQEEITDVVKIECGLGSLTRSFNELISSRWIREDLGDVSVNEEGDLKTSVKGTGLLEVIYKTRFHQYSYDMEDEVGLVYIKSEDPPTLDP